MDPNFQSTHALLARVYEFKGMYDQAASEYLKFPGPGGASTEELARMKEAYTKSGWKAFLHARLDDLLKRRRTGYAPPFGIASLYARLDQKEEAFAWLEIGFEERTYQMTQLNVRPEFDSIRGDPRFVSLVRRVGLTP